MGLPLEAPRVLEEGELRFFYRPRVEEMQPHDLGDVQRLLIHLAPADSPFERLIVVGRKRLPRSAERDRFWGFVDLVLDPYDMNAALGAQTYGTKTRGVRHLLAAQSLAAGNYELAMHGPHAHLSWHLDETSIGPVTEAMELEPDAAYIVTVANPDPLVWGAPEDLDLQGQLFDEMELHVTLPTPFPPDLQKRFRGRRFLALDAREWLDHPGAELVFIGGAGALRA